MTTSPLVRGYLDDLRSVAADRLGPARADELVADIGEHLDAALASGQPVEHAIRRLGSPAEIVAAEAPVTAATHGPAPSRLRAQEIWALILLLGGIVVVGVGWVVGVVLLWTSDRWSTRDKLIGTFLWPGGLGPLLFVGGFATSGSTEIQSCNGSGACTTVTETTGPPGWVGLVVIAVLIVVPVVTTAHLARSAKVPSHA